MDVNSGNGGEMKHNGLRKRLDILGFSQPLPLGAVPLVGALLEDLIKTTESLKAAKDQVHGLLQEKNAWDLGVEAYKCDNSKLLAEVNRLNQELIRQRDQQEAAKCEKGRSIRNLEMDKKYLEEHLQELGERYEELEAKYWDVVDPKRKPIRRPFISTVKSGALIPQSVGVGGSSASDPAHVPVRCHRCSGRRGDIDVELARLQRDVAALNDTISMQSKQASALAFFP